MQYIAIDFETASRAMDSACSIGLVKMDEEGNAIDSYYSLIRPPVLYFDPMCVAVHHIKPSDVTDAPTFDEIWPDVKTFIGTNPLVAHNATFDIGILKSTLEHYGLEPCHNEYYCTLSLSRKLWNNKRCHKLTYLASEFGWEYDAHNALADAEICGRLFSKLCGINLTDESVLSRFFSRIYSSTASSYPKII